MKDIWEIDYELDAIESVANQVLEQLTSKTILLYGDMGAGKTTLIKAIAKVLKSQDDVKSPTFSLVNKYHTENGTIYHFDMYRIEDEEEALQFGFEEYLDSGAWIFIEWPEKIPNLLPDEYNSIKLETRNNTSRALKLTKNINLTNKYGKKLHKSE